MGRVKQMPIYFPPLDESKAPKGRKDTATVLVIGKESGGSDSYLMQQMNGREPSEYGLRRGLSKLRIEAFFALFVND